MKQAKSVFVIMPFRETPTRNRDDLTAFFLTNIKDAIESHTEFAHRYVVGRSDDTLNITEAILHSLFSADVVICDLSGPNANPNVMYELGIRLATSTAPVILIRERHPENRTIFDISGFFIFEYNPFQYGGLEQHLIQKLKKFETGEEAYVSPVLRVLETSPIVVRTITLRRAAAVLNGLTGGFHALSLAAASAMYMFIRNATGIELAGDVDSLTMTASGVLKLIDERKEELKEVKWRTFLFHPASPPALVAYVQDPPLHDVLPDPLPVAFNTILNHFHMRYLATDYLWTMPEAWVPVQFIKDNLLLEHMTDVLLAALATANTPDQKEYVDRFRELILMTSLLPPSAKRQIYPGSFVNSESEKDKTAPNKSVDTYGSPGADAD
jgi:hypothetical protein